MDVRAVFRKLQGSSNKVLVVGLGISGIETAKFLASVGIKTVCMERMGEAQFRKNSKISKELDLIDRSIVEVYFGVDGEKISPFLAGVELAVLSPGVSLESAVCGALKRKHIPFIGELELGVEIIGLPAIVVTGSNGKSTTVTLIDAMLEAGGIKSHLCGNVGKPVLSYASPKNLKIDSNLSDGYLVVEASSYQLESCSVLHPQIGIFLNLSENHLERHGTLDRYLGAKSKLFDHQEKDDFAILNFDDPRVKRGAPRLKSHVLGISREKIKEGAQIYYSPKSGEDRIVLTGVGTSEEVAKERRGIEEEYDISRSKLIGLHNRYDIAAALLAARSLGVTSNVLCGVINEFSPLEHRIERFHEAKGVTYINDSKSTTVAAAVAGVSAVFEAFPAKGILLLIGGLAKAGSWDPLMTYLVDNGDRLKRVICFGKDGKLLASHCQAHNIDCTIATSLAHATELAKTHAVSGDIVLLSPGCASFDEFSDFEDRGNVFKALVLSDAYKLTCHDSHICSST